MKFYIFVQTLNCFWATNIGLERAMDHDIEIIAFAILKGTHYRIKRKIEAVAIIESLRI